MFCCLLLPSYRVRHRIQISAVCVIACLTLDLIAICIHNKGDIWDPEATTEDEEDGLRDSRLREQPRMTLGERVAGCSLGDISRAMKRSLSPIK